MVPLNNISNFGGALELPLIYYEINLILTWPDKSTLSNETKAKKFANKEQRNCLENYAKELLENFKNEKYTHLL